MTRRCQHCGREKEVPKRISRNGTATCHACTARKRRAYNREWARRQTKPCARCGGPKPPGVGRRLCDACVAPPPVVRCRGCRVELPDPTRRTCEACKQKARERKRMTSRAWALANPERMRAMQRRYAERNPEAVREKSRRWYEQMRANPEAVERYRESRRMDVRLRRERAGRPMRPVPEHRYGQASSQWTTDAEPIRALVREWDGSLRELAADAGVSDKLLYRLLHEDGQVTVAAADRIAVALGLHIDLIAEGVGL